MSKQYCMLAQSYDPKRVMSFPVAVENKLDGMRLIAHVHCPSGRVVFTSRSGKELSAFDHMAPALLEMVRGSGRSALVFDGEVTAGDSFATTVSHARRTNSQATSAVYTIFDAVPPSVFFNGCASGPYATRRALLELLLGGAPSGIRISSAELCYSPEGVLDAYVTAITRGYEGVVIKPLDGLYELRRSYAYMKLKQFETADLTIVDAFEGAGKYMGRLGGFICATDEGEVRVGAGLSDRQRAKFWAEFQSGRLIGRIIEVGFQYKTAAGSLRHPRFIRFRDTLSYGVKE